jgi:tetratricopeptide (TPR) repeat protein
MQATSRLSRRTLYIFAVILYLACWNRAARAQQALSNDVPGTKQDASAYIGNGACAKCHAEIYSSYMQTAMARSSGPADENLIAGAFTHKPSGVHDHRILRCPDSKTTGNIASADLPDLIAFPASEAATQETCGLALAWQSIVARGMTMAQPKTYQLLRDALRTSPNDPAILSPLGYISQQRGALDQARSSYWKALHQDPMLVGAATKLGVLEAQQGHVTEAITLWQSASNGNQGKVKSP